MRVDPDSCGGSPPRGRGARRPGSTAHPFGDHPRVGGEHHSIPAAGGCPGSPPRGRGAQPGRSGSAPAGSPPRGGRRPLPQADGPTDHPRVGGEHTATAPTEADSAGPPPRGRGAPAQIAVIRGRLDHPRVRGQHALDAFTAIEDGSTPRARGALGPRSAVPQCHGTTPACAGSTTAGTADAAWGGSPPRARGAQNGVPAAERCGSPRGAGSTPPRPPSSHERGITPACAGSTHTRSECRRSRITPACAGSTPPPKVCPRHRITPACAGSTKKHPADHHGLAGSPPRARGALGPLVGLNAVEQPEGSPPRARGPPIARIPPRYRDGSPPRARGRHGARTKRWKGSPPRARGHVEDNVGHTRFGSPPRARGRLGPRSGPMTGCGSPPRARGQSMTPTDGTARDRITPACAGSTRQRRRAGPEADHPRVRGDEDGRAHPRESGSPPRARGAPKHRLPARRVPVHPRVRGDHNAATSLSARSDRITPACAGSTVALQPLVCWAERDHPRVRGEHGGEGWTLRVAYSDGSPPRARGALTVDHPPLLQAGLDHPRVRGEHPELWPAPRRCVLSDHPRVRGEGTGLATTMPLRRQPRITPACAGSTWPCSGGKVSVIAGSPPRARGWHVTRHGRVKAGTTGSPPRARGAPRWSGADSGRSGVDHPRVRGEHAGKAGAVTEILKRDHPRVRGHGISLHRGSPPSFETGITPACAGSTSPAVVLVSGATGGSPPRAAGRQRT